MARKLRPNAIAGRVDDDEFDQINTYVVASEIAIADLVRLGVKEYMVNHPVVSKDE